MRHRITSSICAFAAVALAATLAGVSRPSSAATVYTTGGNLRVLVLGDSYSAGNGAGSYYGPAGCRRSRRDYGNQFGAIKTRAGTPTSVVVGACSGATTYDYSHVDADGRPAQRGFVNTSYNVVMLTFGGNDANFREIVKQCLVGASDNAAKCDSRLSAAERMIGNGTIRNRLSAVLADIRTNTAAATKIVLVGYPYLERTTTLTLGSVRVGRCLRSLQQEADAMERDLVGDLNQQAYPASPFVFVRTSALFEGSPTWLAPSERVQHELSKTRLNADRWMVAPIHDASLASTDTWYHPNPTGWLREGQLLARSITTQVPPADPHLAFASGPAGMFQNIWNVDCGSPPPGYQVKYWAGELGTPHSMVGSGPIASTPESARGAVQATGACRYSSDSTLGDGPDVKTFSFPYTALSPPTLSAPGTVAAGSSFDVTSTGSSCGPPGAPIKEAAVYLPGDPAGWSVATPQISSDGTWATTVQTPATASPGSTQPLYVYCDGDGAGWWDYFYPLLYVTVASP